MLEPAPPHAQGSGHLDRLRRACAALGCSPAETIALGLLLAAAVATLALLAVLAGPNAGGDPPPPVLEAAEQEVVVHVSGKVAAPGVYRLPAGSRIGDAIAVAGGTAHDADLSGLNLARVLSDGEQVDVGGWHAHEHGAASEQQDAWRSDGRLDLNLATAADLEQLPGVGPVTAQRILDERERLGRFSSVGDLRGVPGIGEKRLQAIVDLIDV